MQSLRNHFLLAMPHLEDPNFAGSLSYLCDHDENGTMGIIVNHPLELTLDVLLERISALLDSPEPGIDSAGYFQTATQALSAQLLLVDMLLARLERRALSSD